jgi:AcrR family transcriptional regulator
MGAVDPAGESSEAIFPRLQSGRQTMSTESIARHQKARLQGAMVEAVARRGFADTTLRELVSLAGVSKATFYQLFDSKQDCFISTFDEIVAELSRRVIESYRRPGDFRQKLVAALDTFMEITVEHPDAAALAAVESLTLGPAGVEHRERASIAFETLVGQSFDHSPSSLPVSPVTVRALVAGIRGIAYRRLRSGEEKEMPGLVEELVDWGLSYQRSPSDLVEAAISAAAEPVPRDETEAGGGDDAPGWTEPPDSPWSRRSLSQRERVVRASARLAVEHGYGALSIPAISAAAGVSNKTFYEHFESKREAFLTAFELLAGKAFADISRAMDAAGPQANGIGVRAMLEHVAANELFARLAFFELQTAGPTALDRADAVLDAFTALIRLAPDSEAPAAEPGPVIREAVGSGIWAVIQHEIAHGRGAQLPQLAPAVVWLAMAPLEEAAALGGGAPEERALQAAARRRASSSPT